MVLNVQLNDKGKQYFKTCGLHIAEVVLGGKLFDLTHNHYKTVLLKLNDYSSFNDYCLFTLMQEEIENLNKLVISCSHL
jgi:hypothetical protein